MAQVIQGCFPHGLPRTTVAVQPLSARPVPAWVQSRLGAGGPPQPVQRHVAPDPRGQLHPNAVPLPSHLVPPPAHGGQPLAPHVLQRMEAAFGASFADVRVHVGPHAQALGATAFTQGTHIHFAPGQYSPDTPQGQQLLGRQLAHVVQQRAGRVRNPFGHGVAIVHDRALEAEANAIVQRLAAVRAPAVIQRSHPVERVLGPHMHEPIRTAIGISQHNYNDAAYLAARAQDLVNAGLSSVNAQTLMVHLGTNIPRRSVFTRAIALAVQFTNNGVPFAVVDGMLTNHHNPLLGGATAAAYTAFVTTLTTGGPAWQYASLDALLTAFTINANNLTLPQWANVAAVLPNDAHADATTFCRIANWNAVSIVALAQHFAGGAFGRTAAEWVAIATALPNNSPNATREFARLAGWTVLNITGTIADRAGNSGGLTAGEWAQIARLVRTPNGRAETADFARIAGWTTAAKVQLATAFGNNNYGATSADWVFCTTRVAVDNHDGARELAHYLGNGWPRQANFNGAVQAIRLIGDGLMYGNANPHVTIHAIDESTSRLMWNRQYHVRLAGGGANVYDFDGANDAFFNNVNMGNAPAARLIATAFRLSMGI